MDKLMRRSEFQIIPAENGWVLLEPISDISEGIHTVVDVCRSEIVAWAVFFHISPEDGFPMRETYPISVPDCTDTFTHYWAAMSPRGKIVDYSENEFQTIEDLILHFNILRGQFNRLGNQR